MVLVVGELQYTSLANLAVDGVAVGALLCLSTLLVYPLADLGTLQVVVPRPSQFF